MREFYFLVCVQGGRVIEGQMVFMICMFLLLMLCALETILYTLTNDDLLGFFVVWKLFNALVTNTF